MSRSPSTPLRLSQDLADLFASGVDLYVASRDKDLRPESVVGVGIHGQAGSSLVTVYVHTEGAARTLANLADNGQVAAALSLPSNHRAVQLKGRVVSVRPSTAADRAVQEAYRSALAESFGVIGIPRALTRGIPWWPSTAIEFVLTELYTQTPGPSAGSPLAP